MLCCTGKYNDFALYKNCILYTPHSLNMYMYIRLAYTLQCTITSYSENMELDTLSRTVLFTNCFMSDFSSFFKDIIDI